MKITYSRFDKYLNIGDDFKIPKKMRAVIMKGCGIENLEMIEKKIPEPGDDQILCRIDAFTICPSIPKLLKQGPEHKFLHGWPLDKYSITLGDEGAVTVVKCGKNLADKYRAGEKYAIQPAVEHGPINHRDKYNDPDRIKKLAIGYTLGGTFAEYILIPEEVFKADCFVKLPSPDLGYYEISLSEPLSCVVSSQDHHLHLIIDPETFERRPVKGLLPGGVTAIFGAGVMARFHIELAIQYKPRCIIVFNRSTKRFEWIDRFISKRAKDNNVDLYMEELDFASLQQTLVKLTGQTFADDIIDTTASPEVVKQVLNKVCGKGTVFNSYGGLNIGSNIIPVDLRKVHYDESILTGSSGGNPSDTVRTLELIHSNSFKVGNHCPWIFGTFFSWFI